MSGCRSRAVKGAKGQRKRCLLADRDGCRCFYCHAPFASPLDATLDHYVPVSLWRNSAVRNLVLACWDCNQRKANALPWPVAWLLIRNQRHDVWRNACQPAAPAVTASRYARAA